MSNLKLFIYLYLIIFSVIDADKSVGRQGKVTVEFTVQDEEKKSIKAHQAFVRVLSKVNYQSVTFVAEQKDGKYSASCK